ncbi:MAG TPA: pyridoxal phosphate-dependent aminotransferase [Synergistales bacterium]|nr:pyridoxal phosphate-dependent aminotransferase [Synergistales bacterium]HRV71999.1 pyridoxal phosphate-dependent aminotransferase [Thermovirgaceae bacterium]
MKFSKRVTGMQSSPIRKLVPYAEAAKAEGKKIYHLNIGQPDIKTPIGFLDSIKKFAEDVIAYSTSHGSYELIDAMIGYYKGYNMNFERKNIIVTNGGSEALSFAFMAICDPEDEILVPEPFYANYNAFGSSVSVKMLPITTKAEKGFHLPPKEEILKKITSRTKGILLSNPGNPTGVIYTSEEMEMIADIAMEKELFIIADEVYREFVYDGLKYTSFGNIVRVEDRVIIVDSISKRYSACGARIGCIISKNDELMAQVMKLAQGRLCVPTLEQVGAVELYKTPASYLEEVNKEYQSRRDILYSKLREMPGVICDEPKGAFYVVAKLPVDDAEKFVIWMLQEFHVNKETVMMAPAEGFYATPGLGKDEVRLAYVLKKEDLAKAMDILKAGLEAYPGRIKTASNF